MNDSKWYGTYWLYSLVIADHFNQYAHTTGVIPDDDNSLLNPRVFKIEDNTLVIQLLSVPLQSDQKSNDQLYKVIMDLVSAVFSVLLCTETGSY